MVNPFRIFSLLLLFSFWMTSCTKQNITVSNKGPYQKNHLNTELAASTKDSFNLGPTIALSGEAYPKTILISENRKTPYKGVKNISGNSRQSPKSVLKGKDSSKTRNKNWRSNIFLKLSYWALLLGFIVFFVCIFLALSNPASTIRYFVVGIVLGGALISLSVPLAFIGLIVSLFTGNII